MDMNDEREIGRRLREAAEAMGLQMAPDGFRLIVNLDEDDNSLVVHAVFLAREDVVERKLAEALDPGAAEQVQVDDMFESIIKEQERHERMQEREQKVESVKDDILKSLREEGGFL